MNHELYVYRRPAPTAPTEPGDFLAEYQRRLTEGAPAKLAWRHVMVQVPERSPRRSGYLYVFQWSDGLLKVGWTQSARTRIGCHCGEARKQKLDVSAFWISKPIYDYETAEAVLIDLCAEVGTRIKKEYFRDLDFERAVEFADKVVGAQAALSGQPFAEVDIHDCTEAGCGRFCSVRQEWRR